MWLCKAPGQEPRTADGKRISRIAASYSRTAFLAFRKLKTVLIDSNLDPILICLRGAPGSCRLVSLNSTSSFPTCFTSSDWSRIIQIWPFSRGTTGGVLRAESIITPTDNRFFDFVHCPRCTTQNLRTSALTRLPRQGNLANHFVVVLVYRPQPFSVRIVTINRLPIPPLPSTGRRPG